LTLWPSIPWPPSALHIGVLATGLVASACDVRTRRIPNALTFGSAAVALALSAATADDVRTGLTAALWSVTGWLVGLVLFLPVFLLRGLGGGDVKLLAAFGAWLGPAGACWTALYASVAGGVLALPLLLAKRALGRTLANVWGLLGYWRLAGVQPHPDLTLDAPGAIRLPYALPITIGALLALWWRT
jgi:prepilin peptidase CpaA